MLIEKSTEQTIRLYYDLYTPDRVKKPAPLLIALHGYEGNKESMMAKARIINSSDFHIASVQGPNSFLVRPRFEGHRDEGEAASGNQGVSLGGAATPKIGFGWMMQ
ncbi:MAG TPA: hypothetical protein VJX67_03620 [Blastocatellia bacterium]|nr:hypothetical protein [Blastocatellia bacterium]